LCAPDRALTDSMSKTLKALNGSSAAPTGAPATRVAPYQLPVQARGAPGPSLLPLVCDCPRPFAA